MPHPLKQPSVVWLCTGFRTLGVFPELCERPDSFPRLSEEEEEEDGVLRVLSVGMIGEDGE